MNALKMHMFHWKHVQLIFYTSNVVKTCKLSLITVMSEI